MGEALDLSLFATPAGDGMLGMELAVDGIACGACIARIESAVKRLPGVTEARLNFTNRRLHVAWSDGAIAPAQILQALESIGYHGHPFAPLTRRAGRSGRDAPAHALARRRRLRRHERHAAVGGGLVGQRDRHHAGDARFLPLGLGAHRAAGGGLCRAAVLQERLAGFAYRVAQHGRADLAWRHPGARHVGGGNRASRQGRLLRFRHHAAASSCWSGARSTTPCGARRGRSPAIWRR